VNLTGESKNKNKKFLSKIESTPKHFFGKKALVTGNRYCNAESVRCYSVDKLMCNGNDTGHLVPPTPKSHANWQLWGKHIAPKQYAPQLDRGIEG
jgi:hypothetical protein